MRAVQRVRWVVSLVAALASLSLLPGSARADKRLDDLADAADTADDKLRHLIDEERYAEAIAVGEEQVAAREKLVALLRGRLPKQHSEQTPSQEEFLAQALDRLSVALIASGDYARPEPLLARAAELHHKVLAPGSPWLVFHLREIARLAVIKGDYAAAERALKQVVEHSSAYAPGNAETGAAFAYSELGRLYTIKGDYARAEPLLKQGREGASVQRSSIYDNLGELYLERVELEDAEPVLQRSLKESSFWAGVYGAPSPSLARSLDNLGRLNLALAVPVRAAELFARALEIKEKTLGPEHPAVAVSLDGLGESYLRSGDPARAEAPLTRALALREKKLGPDHLETATSRLHLGDLRRESGDHAAADDLYQRALAAREKALGADHAAVGEALLHRAALRFDDGDLPLAESLGQRASAVFDKALGAEHLRVADALDLLGAVYLAAGKADPALHALERSLAIRDRAAAARLAVGTEEQKLAVMGTLRRQTDLVLSLPGAAGRDRADDAAALALTAVLRRKGRALDALAEGRAALRDRQSPEDKTLLDELVSIQSKIVDLIVRGPGIEPVEKHRAAIAELEKQKQRLEAEVSKQSAKLVIDDRLVTLAEVQRTIPADGALVEMLVYQPSMRGQEKSRPRVLGFVVKRRGAVAAVDLGEAAEIEALIGPLRAALSDPTKDPARIARALDDKVTRPLRPLLGEARRVLISPDGALNLVPFGALIDEDGRALLERWSFTYLSSGRDLLRYTYDETPRDPGLPALVVGSPDFGDEEKKRSRFRAEDKVRLRRSIEMSDMRFPSLPGTAEEAAAIGAVIPGAKVLTGAEATEEAVKAAAHPRILHLATHGFFLPNQAVLAVARGSRGLAAAAMIENPLLRSGLALASANQPVPGKEDGILTALEASGLDLYGTRLVVLSACETGVGEARNGDGVYGLRRALWVAGAQTLVMSLWKISDQATRAMMVAYYQKLQQGGGRSEAMREVALAIRADGQHAHPYYWASFIVSGDGSNLEGKSVPVAPIQLARVAPGPRGCGCRVVGGEGGDGAALFGVAMLGLWMRRRKR